MVGSFMIFLKKSKLPFSKYPTKITIDPLLLLPKSHHYIIFVNVFIHLVLCHVLVYLEHK